MTLNRIHQKARSLRKQMQPNFLIEADMIEVANDDGVTSVRVTDPDTHNLIWVKLYGQDERVVQAYNGRTQVRANLPVWVRQLADGTYEVEGMRSRDGTEYLGEGLGTMNTPEQVGELLGTVWPARNLKPGRARLSQNGGMKLTIESFYYSGGVFSPPSGRDIDLTSYIPATTDKQVWAVVWYDPVTDALGATTGTEYDLPYTMTEIDLGAIAIPVQYIRLAGVILTEGDTALSSASVIVAAQNWLDPPVTDENFFPITVTDARTIPSNRQLVISQVTIDTGGSIDIDGILEILG